MPAGLIRKGRAKSETG